MVLDLLKARLEQPAYLVMAPLKFREHLVQKAVDLRFRQRHHPRANLNGALLGEGIERTHQDACPVRVQGQPSAFDLDFDWMGPAKVPIDPSLFFSRLFFQRWIHSQIHYRKRETYPVRCPDQ